MKPKAPPLPVTGEAIPDDILEKLEQEVDLEQDDNVVGYLTSKETLVPYDTPAGRQVKEWMEKGVPSFQGTEEGDIVSDNPTIRMPDDSLFGLALLEEIERRGWEIH